jgi:hypothetical protein
MSPSSGSQKAFLGVAAGAISSIAGLVLAYIGGVLAIGISMQDLFATILAAVTFLPLMLIIVFLLPNLALGVMIGFLLGAGSNYRARPFGAIAGAIAGSVCSEIVFSFAIPLIVKPQPGDFVSIIANHYLSAVYGVIIGTLTGCIFRWFNKGRAGQRV